MKTLDKFFVFIYLILVVNFFDFINISGTWLESLASYSQKKLLFIITLLYLLFRGVVYSRGEKLRRHFSPSVVFIVIATIIIILASSAKYGQSLISTFFVGYPMLVLIAYYIFTSVLIDRQSWISFVDMMLLFSGLLSFSKILQSFVLVHFNKLIFYINATADKDALSKSYTLLGFTRMASASDYVFFALLMAIFISVSGLDKSYLKKHIVSNSFSVLFLVLVGQTRSYIMMLLVAMIFLFANRIYKRLRGGGLLGLSILLSPVLLFGVYHFIQKFIVNASDAKAYSVNVRFSAINYYLDQMNYSSWYGIGFARDDLYTGLIHGANSWGTLLGYNFDDVGIIGFFGQYGYIGVVFILLLAIDTMRILIFSKNKFAVFLLLGILMVSFITTSYTNPQRVAYLPILLTAFDFVLKWDNQEEQLQYVEN